MYGRKNNRNIDEVLYISQKVPPNLHIAKV